MGLQNCALFNFVQFKIIDVLTPELSAYRTRVR